MKDIYKGGSIMSYYHYCFISIDINFGEYYHSTGNAEIKALGFL